MLELKPLVSQKDRKTNSSIIVFCSNNGDADSVGKSANYLQKELNRW